MNNVRIPGIVWVILLLGLGIGIQTYSTVIQSYTGLDPLVIAFIATAIFGAAKAKNTGDGQLNDAIDVIQKLLTRPKTATGPGVGMRSAETIDLGPGSIQMGPGIEPEIPKRPNSFTRWLVG